MVSPQLGGGQFRETDLEVISVWVVVEATRADNIPGGGKEWDEPAITKLRSASDYLTHSSRVLYVTHGAEAKDSSHVPGRWLTPSYCKQTHPEWVIQKETFSITGEEVFLLKELLPSQPKR